MIAHVIDDGPAPPELRLAGIAERFGMDAVGGRDVRLVHRMQRCRSLVEPLMTIRRHLEGKEKTLDRDIMPLADEVMRYKYAQRGEVYPKDLDESPEVRSAKALAEAVQRSEKSSEYMSSEPITD